jgi:hypothetical protein
VGSGVGSEGSSFAIPGAGSGVVQLWVPGVSGGHGRNNHLCCWGYYCLDLFFHQLMVDGVSQDDWLCLIENYRGFDWIVNDHFQY